MSLPIGSELPAKEVIVVGLGRDDIKRGAQSEFASFDF